MRARSECVLVLALVACRATQRDIGPMPLPGPLAHTTGAPPAGPASVEGSAIVVRHTDPVYVQRPGASDGYPLRFWSKKDRVAPGGRVRSGAGGQAELIWPGTTSSIVLFDEGRVRVGDPSREEALVLLEAVTTARLFLEPADRVVLVGGAVLRGDAEGPSGPFVLERTRTGMLALENRSLRSGEIAYRDEVLVLGPGETIELPVLETSSAPLDVPLARTVMDVAGLGIQCEGRVEASGPDEQGRLQLLALEKSRVFVRGIELLLDQGERALVSTSTLGEP